MTGNVRFLGRVPCRVGNLDAPCALKDIGMPAEGLDRAADLAASAPYPNPRALECQALRALLQRAWEGAPPAA